MADELIFESGLSTAKKVNEISGRGVGMGAVRKFLKNLGGNVEIEISEGPEDYLPFKFRISIPTHHVRLYPGTSSRKRYLELVTAG